MDPALARAPPRSLPSRSPGYPRGDSSLRLDSVSQTRPDYSVFDEEVPSPMSVASSLGGRSRRATFVEEGVSKVRRLSLSQFAEAKRHGAEHEDGCRSVPGGLREESAPSLRLILSGYDRWTPTSSRASPSPSCSLAGPPAGVTPGPNTPAHSLKGPPFVRERASESAQFSSGPGYGSPQTQPPVPNPTPMPNFTGAESRHGRPRK